MTQAVARITRSRLEAGTPGSGGGSSEMATTRRFSASRPRSAKGRRECHVDDGVVVPAGRDRSQSGHTDLFQPGLEFQDRHGVEWHGNNQFDVSYWEFGMLWTVLCGDGDWLTRRLVGLHKGRRSAPQETGPSSNVAEAAPGSIKSMSPLSEAIFVVMAVETIVLPLAT